MDVTTNSAEGLEYILEDPEYTEKLAKSVDSENGCVKLQVVQLLSALAVYNARGYQRALQVIHKHKELSGNRYRFKWLIGELASSKDSPEYQTALLAFINCLIASAPDFKHRIQIRNELIGLKLHSILSDLRKSSSGSNPELMVQLEVFEEQRENDETQMLDAGAGVDLNSHADIFYTILKQVSDTPQEMAFLSILQHLLRIDPKEAVSDIIWDTAETLVHRATLMDSVQDAARILRSPSIGSKLCCHCRKQSIVIPTSPPPTPQYQSPAQYMPLTPIPAAPPPPPPPPAQTSPPPPPPMAPNSNQKKDTSSDLLSIEEQERIAKLRLPQQETPTPRAKMKTLNWNKIPNNKVLGQRNIWSVVAHSHQHSPMEDLDWSEMEGLFCLQSPPSAISPSPSNQTSPKLGGRDSIADTYDRRRRETTEINLLDGKRSLNVNIFLKQFRCCNEEIIKMIKCGGHDDIGAEKLKGLLKILPELDELEMLRAFDGDKSRLGNAEKFLLQLIKLPNYKLRIESMLLKEEFASNMSYLEPSINAMIVAGGDLMTNKRLQEVLYLVVCAGNFLNAGGYAGNAAGVKLSSLQKLTDIRANKPGMNLIHYVAQQVDKKKKDLLQFTNDMAGLEEATKTTVEQLKNEANALDNRLRNISKQIELPSTEEDIKLQMRDFIKQADSEMRSIQRDLSVLESTRLSLAEFFCEDASTFKIEECFKIFHGFCTKFKLAVTENERRKCQEEEAAARRKQREDQLATKRRMMIGMGGSSTACSPVSTNGENDGDSLIMMMMTDAADYNNRSSFRNRKTSGQEDSISLTGSPAPRRRRLGSITSNDLIGPHFNQSMEMDYSPDVTPNGTLRRRRTRTPLEEEDTNLMEYLKSGVESADTDEIASRDRKAWGSLDRSWARRARGVPKKRPDLLALDFNADRERKSPTVTPSTDNAPTPPPQVTKPKGWRTKIEAWLMENEKDVEKPNSDRAIKPGSSEYRRVYSDWKPSVEKTEAIGNAEVNADGNCKKESVEYLDKSKWRKSELNAAVESSGESDGRKLRRIRSRGSIDVSPPLQAIEEEEKRKSYLSELGDSSKDLSVKINPTPKGTSNSNSPQEDETLPPFAPRRTKKFDFNNEKTCREITEPNRECVARTDDDLGDGNFDRHSTSRITRRYKKAAATQDEAQNTDSCEAEPEIGSSQKRSIPRYHPSSNLGGNQLYSTLPHSFKPKIRATIADSGIMREMDEKSGSEKPDMAKNEALVCKPKLTETLSDEGFEESYSSISDSQSQGTLSGNYDSIESSHNTVPTASKDGTNSTIERTTPVSEVEKSASKNTVSTVIKTTPTIQKTRYSAHQDQKLVPNGSTRGTKMAFGSRVDASPIGSRMTSPVVSRRVPVSIGTSSRTPSRTEISKTANLRSDIPRSSSIARIELPRTPLTLRKNDSYLYSRANSRTDSGRQSYLTPVMVRRENPRPTNLTRSSSLTRPKEVSNSDTPHSSKTSLKSSRSSLTSGTSTGTIKKANSNSGCSKPAHSLKQPFSLVFGKKSNAQYAKKNLTADTASLLPLRKNSSKINGASFMRPTAASTAKDNEVKEKTRSGSAKKFLL